MEDLDSKIREYLSDIGQRGGATTLGRHGAQEMKAWASRGGRARAKKHSPEQLKKWARMGGRPRKVRADGAVSESCKPKE